MSTTRLKLLESLDVCIADIDEGRFATSKHYDNYTNMMGLLDQSIKEDDIIANNAKLEVMNKENDYLVY